MDTQTPPEGGSASQAKPPAQEKVAKKPHGNSRAAAELLAKSRPPPKSDKEDEKANETERLDNEYDNKAIEIVMSKFTKEQMSRYEAFRRGHLAKPNVKKLIQSFSGQACDDLSGIVVQGAAKLYVGELTEMAKEVMAEFNEDGPILPHHLREAHRRLKKLKYTPTPRKYKKRLF